MFKEMWKGFLDERHFLFFVSILAIVDSGAFCVEKRQIWKFLIVILNRGRSQLAKQLLHLAFLTHSFAHQIVCLFRSRIFKSKELLQFTFVLLQHFFQFLFSIRSISIHMKQSLMSPLSELWIMINVDGFIIRELRVKKQKLSYHMFCVYIHKVHERRIVF